MDRSIKKSSSQILKITKKYIQNGDKFTDYYVNKKNKIFKNQLPLIKSPTGALGNNDDVYRSIEVQQITINNFNKNQNNKQDNKDILEYENKIKNNNNQSAKKCRYSLFRKIPHKPVKLPKLCPLYNDEGNLIKSIIKTSKIFQPQTLGNSISASNLVRPINKTINKNDYVLPQVISMNKFLNEFFKDEELYKDLKYNEDLIFFKNWDTFVINKIDELKNKKNENFVYSKNKKIFLGRENQNKINFSLFSLKIKFTKLISNCYISDDDKSNISYSELEINNELSFHKDNDTFYEFYLPFNLLPIFYFKGINNFLFFLLKMIQFKNNNNINNENNLEQNNNNIIEAIEIKEEEIYKFLNENSNIFNFKHKNRNDTEGIIQSYACNSMVTSLPRQNIKKSIISENDNYIKNKYNENSNVNKILHNNDYNIYSFYWITTQSNYQVDIILPYVSFVYETHRVKIIEFIPMEMMLFLIEKNFQQWDFYLINYLFSFYKFRNCFKQLLSQVNKLNNKKVYLTPKRIKKITYKDYFLLCIFTNKNFQNYLAKLNSCDLKVSLQSGIFSYIDEYYILLTFDQLKKVTFKNQNSIKTLSENSIKILFNKEKLLQKFLRINTNLDLKNEKNKLVYFNYEGLNYFDINKWADDLIKYSIDFIDEICNNIDKISSTNNINTNNNMNITHTTNMNKNVNNNLNDYISNYSGYDQKDKENTNDKDTAQMQSFYKNSINNINSNSSLLSGYVEVFCVTEDFYIKKIREIDFDYDVENEIGKSDDILNFNLKVLNFIDYHNMTNELQYDDYSETKSNHSRVKFKLSRNMPSKKKNSIITKNFKSLGTNSNFSFSNEGDKNKNGTSIFK